MLDALLRLSFENDLITIDRIVSAELDLVNYYIDIDNLFDGFDSYTMQNITTIISNKFRIKVLKSYFNKI